jgi:crotonobetainyl-CoA:carnitine CoA-transferase CaiB-like acyl-CoA transferase
VEQAFATRDSDEWLERLNKHAGFPFSLVREYADVAEGTAARVWRFKKQEVFK